jgi:hypothetical protein
MPTHLPALPPRSHPPARIQIRDGEEVLDFGFGFPPPHDRVRNTGARNGANTRLRHQRMQLPAFEFQADGVGEGRGAEWEFIAEGVEEAGVMWEDDWEDEVLQDNVGVGDVPPPEYEEVEADLPVYAELGENLERLAWVGPDIFIVEVEPPAYEVAEIPKTKTCGCYCKIWRKVKKWFRVREQVVGERREIAVHEYNEL